MAFDCVHPKIIRPEKTGGHHPGLDEGPESFQECFVRPPPSSALGFPYVEGNNPDHGEV
jgi:hypothetical protein